jgi:acyl carrier protein
MTESEALSWLAELFEEQVENISHKTHKDDIEGWDSLGVLTLMAAFDEEFDVLLSEEEMAELEKIEDIFDVLRKHNILDK